MACYLGLDVGTTTLSTIILEVPSGRLLAHITLDHNADVTAPEDRARGRAELSLDRLYMLILQALRQTLIQAQEPCTLLGLGVTGQMHGLALLGSTACPLAPAITWQDRRALDVVPGSSETYLQRFVSLAGGGAAFEQMGCLPAAGYLGPSLFWLQENHQLSSSPARVCLIPDATVAMLTGRMPPTDPTDGGSSGLMDIVTRCWDWELIARLGLPQGLFPEVCEPGAWSAPLAAEVARATGLPAGLPVFNALGDNQASFLGSVAEPDSSLLINVGTGGQISALVEGYQRRPGLDTRYCPGGRYLLVGAGLFGGRSYAYLRAFFRRVGVAFFGSRGDDELYDAMNRLAAAVPSGADGLRCAPLFTGSRLDPSLRASFTGLTPENFFPGHLTRALLEGIAEGFYAFYTQMQAPPHQQTEAGQRQSASRELLIGSGNGIRRNSLLAEILAHRFALPLAIPALEEEAAVGAALVAAVGAGELPNLAAAGRLLRYIQAQ